MKKSAASSTKQKREEAYAVYDAAYAGMNTEQKLAVDSIEGPVFVVAGPGTGKTQVLTLRIANILRQTDTPPESILALTFTESAAREMRFRLARIIGTRAANVRITTFHGFAETLIHRFPEHFPRIIGSQVATPAERAELLEKVLRATPVQHLRPFNDPLYYHYDTGRAISTLKRENVTPNALDARLKEEWLAFENTEGKVHAKGKYEGQMKGAYLSQQKRLERTEDLANVYRAYEDALATARRYDFEDLILEAIRMLGEDESLRLQVQESVLYVLADEHQDANRAQNALLELVSGFYERPNLFIVGDEKQAIYRFQGADLDTMQHFRATYADTTILTLIENYRSTQTILDIALSLIAASPDERLSRVPLIANAPHAARPITRTACSDESQEMDVLAERIGALIHGSGKERTAEALPADEIAVLVRRNKDVSTVLTALATRGIPVSGADDANALKNRFVEALIRLLTAVNDPRDEQLAGVLFLPGFSLSVADVASITRYAREQRRSILSILGDPDALLEAKVRNIDGVTQLSAAFQELVRLAAVERPATVAQQALQSSGLLRVILAAPDRAQSLGAVRALLASFEALTEREHGAQLGRALAILTLHEERSIPLKDAHAETVPERVQVMTVHKAKGREFSQVFIPMLTTRAWSTRNRAEYFELPDILSGAAELEDERRLLYVAITRAKQHATLSYAATANDGRPQEASPLLNELAPELLEDSSPNVGESNAPGATEGTDSLSKFAERLESIPALADSRANASAQPSPEDLETLRSVFLSQGLSPTALNNYLECPWKYFYVNLLRIPETKGNAMLYGTAIHAALKRYADKRARAEEPDADVLVSWFAHSASRLPLSQPEIMDMQQKGERALRAWWEAQHDAWPQNARAEVPLEASITLSAASGKTQETLLVRGTLDRIDQTPEGATVIDYKTGKQKTRNELMGGTKNADGNNFRQLTFYKLLLEQGTTPEPMHQGIIEFVEPDEKGRMRTERFDISEADVEELVTTIQRTAKSILTLSFWNEPCDEEECRWCTLRFGLS